MLVSNTKPLLVLYHYGYLRLSMNEFNNDDNNLITHLTNQVRSLFLYGNRKTLISYEYVLVFPKERSSILWYKRGHHMDYGSIQRVYKRTCCA